MPERTPAHATIAALDGYPLAADVWPAERPATTVAINSAMGVPRRYYRAFAGHLAAQGMAVVSYDYRGIGDSAPKRLRGFPARARDWGQLDFAGVLGWMRAQHPTAATAVVGHSIGGQLLALAPNADQLAGAVLVGAQAGSWRHWPGLNRLGMAALWYAVIPALATLAGRLPMSWFGLGQDVPSGVAREWARWGRSRDYLFDPRHGLPLSGYARLDIPVRAYSFADDRYAPRPSVEALLRRFPAAQIEHHHGSREGGRVGHFGFFRAGVVPALWGEASEWLLGLGALGARRQK
jgi:predicted alpha/beta hydrolase